MMMKMKMSKKSNGDGDHVGGRAWMLLRVALLWARKGGVFKRRLMMELRVVPKFLKSLANAPHKGHNHKHDHRNIHYLERQLSFDKTPIFPTSSSSSMRFLINNIPCLNPALVLDHFDDDEVDMIINNHDDHHNHNYHNDYGSNAGAAGYAPYYDDDDDDEDEEKVSAAASNYNNNYEEDDNDSVDKKADEFIAKFYQQIKLQRQISYVLV